MHERLRNVLIVDDVAEYRHDSGSSGSAELQALLNAAVDAIVLSDSQGRIMAFNPAAEKLFGYRSADIVGERIEILMPEPYRSAHAGHMRRYLETGAAHIIGIGREVLAVKSNGEVFPIWLSVGEAVQGNTRSFVGIIRDLSLQRAAERERHALEARLEHVGKFSLMGEMAAGVAHEINQPLAAIATYAEAVIRMLSHEALDRDSLLQACNGVAAQARRASQVIENLRNLTRKREVKREMLDVNDIIRDAMTLVEADANAAGIPVAVQYAPKLARIYADAAQLQQVLLNLTRNAVDAMSNSMQKTRGIQIATEAVGEERVRLSVRDHGAGVSPRLADDIFHPFVTTKREGLGVGLAISRTIVESHGGELTFREVPEGGAVFVVSLPAGRGERFE
jgi:two-component system sensor kinase FixL